MTEQQRDEFNDKQQFKKDYRRMKEMALWEEFLESIGKTEIPPEEEIWVRKMIRKDVKVMIRKERERLNIYSEDEYYDPRGEYRMDDRIIYGSSSENDIDEEVWAKAEALEDAENEEETLAIEEEKNDMKFEEEKQGP